MINSTHFHPMIVHFPIALITIGFVAEVFSLFFKTEKCLSKTGFYLMVIGALAAIAAWVTGKFFTFEPTEGSIVEIFEKHETGALITLILIVIAAVFRIWLVIKKKEETPLKWLAFAIYFLAFAAVTFTGLMGGIMVYDYLLSF